MAGKSVIGALRVNLGLNSAQFTKGIAKSKSQASKFGKFLKTTFVLAASAAIAALGSITFALQKFLSNTDELAKMAKSIGTTTESLSQLKHAADLSGLDFGALSGGMKKLAKSMSDSLRSATSEQAMAFKALGISVLDSQGKMKSLDLMLSQVSDKFAKYKDSAAKTALAMAIFGKSGAKLIPLLNESSRGIAAMKKEADRLGATISGKLAASTERFNDNMTRLKLVGQGYTNQLAESLLPAMNVLAQHWIDSTKKGKAFGWVIKWVSLTFRVLISAVLIAIDTLKIFSKMISGAVRSSIAMLKGDFDGAAKISKETFESIKTTGMEAWAALKRIWSDRDGSLQNESKKLAQTLSAPVLKAAKKTKDASKNMAEQIIGNIDPIKDKFSELKGVIGSHLSGVFDSFVEGTFDARKALSAFVKDLFKMASNKLITNLLGSLFGGGNVAAPASNNIGGGIFAAASSIFAGFFKDGGKIGTGKIGVVGDDGPELIEGPATVHSNKDMSKMLSNGSEGASVTMNNDFRGADSAAIGAISDRIDKLQKSLPDFVNLIRTDHHRLNPGAV